MEHEEFIRSGARTMTTVNRGALCCGGECAAVRVAISLWRFSHKPIRPFHAAQEICYGSESVWILRCSSWTLSTGCLQGQNVLFVRRWIFFFLLILFLFFVTPLSAHRTSVPHKVVPSVCASYERKVLAVCALCSFSDPQSRDCHVCVGTYFKNCPKSSQMFSQPGHLHTPWPYRGWVPPLSSCSELKKREAGTLGHWIIG